MLNRFLLAIIIITISSPAQLGQCSAFSPVLKSRVVREVRQHSEFVTTATENIFSSIWGSEKFKKPGVASQLHGHASNEPSSRLSTKSLLREMFAESIGTFIIVQIGTGAVMSAIFDQALVGLFQIASVWIIAVTIAIATTASISGAHLNPAISIALALLRPHRGFGVSKLLGYIGAQLIGAITGSWVNLLLYREKILAFEKAQHIVRGTQESISSAKAFGEYYTHPISTQTAFLAEAFGTAVLAFVVFSLTNPKNGTQEQKVFIPPLIGLTVGALIAVLAPLTQAGLNPARDFGPRIVAFCAGWKRVAFQGWWVYVIAPMMGAPIGGFVADTILHGKYLE